MSNRYDLVVIGAGLNGLAAATLVAKKGRRVAVVEKTTELGGLATGWEFHPGFHTSGVLHDTTGLRSWVVDALDLKRFGLSFKTEETPIYTPMRQGRGLLLWRNPQRAEEELAPLSQKDVKAYRDYRDFVGRVTPVLRKVFDEFPPDVMTMSFPGLWDLGKKAMSLRMLGKNDMMEILRIAPMCVADWLNEFFETDALKALLAAPAIYHSVTGPWSPGTNMNLLLDEALAGGGVVGGPAALARAFVQAAKAQGVELLTGTEVKSVSVRDRTVHGVELAGGNVLEASKVAAACDPKQLFGKLVDPSEITLTFAQNVRNIRARGTTARVALALNSYPELNGRPSLKPEIIRTGEAFDRMERAFDQVKYRQMSEEPLLDIYVPTLESPELAPSGKHVMQVLVHFAPHALEGGWSDEAKKVLYERTLTEIEHFMPDVRRQVLGAEVLSPVDLEHRFSLTGGHLYHAEHAADQLLVRPTPECSRYATPVQGLFLCGAGAHPGGGLTGAPGALAAKAILS